MSAYEPPTIISTIYNPAFFETSATNTITQAQANALYLKKKTADTATALETFSAGIATTSLAASSFATVGGTLGVTGVLTGTGNINTNSLGSIGGTLALGGLDIINLGTSGGRSAACSINTVGTGLTAIAGNVGQTIRMFGATQGTEYQYDNTNLIVGTQNMALYSTQTSGRLDIGTGARLLTGQGGGINVGTGSGGVANPITIGGASSALTLNGGNISIGNSFSTTTLNGVISFANLAIDSVDRATAGTLSLGTSIANLVNISRSTIDTAILGTLSVAETTTLNGGLTIGGTNNITLGNGTVASTSLQLGYIKQGTLSTSSNVIADGQTIDMAEVEVTAGTWIIVAEGKPAVAVAGVSFGTSVQLRYNISPTSITYANALTYAEYNNFVFQSAGTVLPYVTMTTMVNTLVTKKYFMTLSPTYGNGALTTGGTNITVGTNIKMKAIRIA